VQQRFLCCSGFCNKSTTIWSPETQGLTTRPQRPRVSSVNFCHNVQTDLLTEPSIHTTADTWVRLVLLKQTQSWHSRNTFGLLHTLPKSSFHSGLKGFTPWCKTHSNHWHFQMPRSHRVHLSVLYQCCPPNNCQHPEFTLITYAVHLNNVCIISFYRWHLHLCISTTSEFYYRLQQRPVQWWSTSE